MSVIGSNILAGASGQGGEYTIEESLRFNASQSSYLSWTPASAGNRKTWTFSAWVKYSVIDNGAYNAPIFWANGAGSSTGVSFEQSPNTAHRLFVYNAGLQIETTQVFRDPSSWYHIVAVVDNTQATSSNRTKLYINGVQVTSFTTASYPAQNTDGSVSEVTSHTIGQQTGLSRYFDGYITEVNFIDGQALDASSFGEFDAVTGVWKPKEYTGTYGTNGFYLPMKLDNTTEGFNTVTYLGTGSKQNITGVGFSPDLIWIKNRIGANSHYLYDSVRGANKSLTSNSTSAEDTASGQLDSFNTDGFTVPSDTAGYNNYSGRSYVAWCWDAGNTTVTNTDGSITSSVRANPTYGFSVVSYTGNATNDATIGHGLGATPKFIIVKNRATATYWYVYHGSLASTYNLYLNDTASAQADNVLRSANSTTFTVSSSSAANGSSQAMIAYCFSEVSGYSKFGSYTGNGGTNAITTGFKPAFVLFKRTDTAGYSWYTFDSTRNGVNPVNTALYPDLTNTDTTQSTYNIDFTDTGFTINNSNNALNASGGTYIYMAFKDTREYAFWLDDSGNNNDWQPNGGITTESTVTDTPTPYLGGGNYAVLNPLDNFRSATPTNGNLSIAGTGSCKATMPFVSGKWYWEFSVTGLSGVPFVGIATDTTNAGITSGNYWLYRSDGLKQTTSGASAYGASYASGDVIGIAYDADTHTLTFYKNNTSQGDISVTSGFVLFPMVVQSSSTTYNLNFGQRPFAYTPPTGFKALHTGNLPDSTIVDGSKYFDAVLYSGSTASEVSVTGLGFQPDFVWDKNRNNAYNHYLWDAVRGATKYLSSNLTTTETTDANSLKSFDSDGFTLGAGATFATMSSGNSHVGWAWKAGGTGVTNTDGSITSTVSANPTAGFSIVSYTGDGNLGGTVGHGLGVAPSLIICKERTATGNWPVYHKSVGKDGVLILNLTNGTTSSSNYWGSGGVTSTVFGTSTATGASNGTNQSIVAYCFAEVEGYSRISSFVGNGSADGPFVYTGMKPRFILIKASSTGGYSWNIIDTARDTYNTQGLYLFANTSGAEGSGSNVDILSNGFKLRNAGAGVNGSGITYIYAAFAENPFKNSLAR